MPPVTGVPVYSAPKEGARFTPRYEIWKSAIIAGEILPDNPDFVRVHPDNGMLSNFALEDGVENTYVKRADFREITEFSPINVFDDTKNPDKLAIVLYNGYYPEGLFLEKDRVFAYIPVGLGGTYASSSSWPGDYHVSSIRVTCNMRTLHGVPFTCFYNRTEGKAFHGTTWKDWSKIRRGYFGSAGCINLPSYAENSLYNVSWDGFTMGFDHFFFRWLKTVFPFDVYKQEMMEVPWDTYDWYTGEHTMRTIVGRRIESLWNYPTHPLGLSSYKTWDSIITAYQGLKAGGNWILPHKENGQVSFLTVPQG